MTISQLSTVGMFGVVRGEILSSASLEGPDRRLECLWPIPEKLGAIATLNSLGR